MPWYLSLVVYVIFLIYIIISIYYFKRTKRANNYLLTFMTSFLILFTCTILISTDLVSSGSKQRVGNETDIRNKIAWVNSDESEVKVTAYLTNPNPAPGTVTYLNVTGPVGGKLTVICQYKGHSTPYFIDIGRDSHAVIPINVESDAEKGYAVNIDVIVQHEGKTYRTNTVFTPM